MVTPAKGSIVLIPFPFSDLSQAKLRPALVLAHVSKGDWIMSQITSQAYSDTKAIELQANDFASGSLRTISFVRPGKLFTANQSLIRLEVGLLKRDKFNDIVAKVIALFQ